MTQPSPRTPVVRRTVTIAVALVAGQLTLCSVIGWLIFGSLFTPSARHQRDVDSPAPTVSYADPPVSTAPSAPDVTTSDTGRGESGPRARATPSLAATIPARPTTDEAVVLPTAPAAGGPVQRNVQIGAVCIPEYAEGRTPEGEVVFCRRVSDLEPRWRRS